jgi:hypothetical protein
VRDTPDGDLEAILVLGTLGAPERRLIGGKRPRELNAPAEPEAVPTARATVVRPEPFRTPEQASSWLARARHEAEAEVDAAVKVLNRALRAQRAAAADPYLGDVSARRALVTRIGYGRGDAVADGRFAAAFELPGGARQRARRSMEAPEERFAALLGGRERPLLAEEHVLRARADLDAGRPREAALEARIALECLLQDLPAGRGLAEHRDALREAANQAIGGLEPTGVAAAVEAMEAELRRHRLGG